MMITFFRKKAVARPLSTLAAFSLFFTLITPTNVFGFEGPKQPEMGGFVPVGFDQMVDPFTGDLNYNIPLMTVPGPGGGYPINLAYTGGTMNQESSWVGWGWNVNPGLINRQMRGLPDDFDGTQVVEKDYREKDEHNLLINVGFSPSEVAGADLKYIKAAVGANLNIVYNNKRSWALKLGLDLQLTPIEANKGSGDADQTDPKEKKDEDKEGQSAETPSKADIKEVIKSKFDVDAYIAQINETKVNAKSFLSNSALGLVAGGSFSNTQPIASFVQHPRVSTSTTFQGKIGGSLFTVSGDFPFTASYSLNRLATNRRDLYGLGYLYTNNGPGTTRNLLMDYRRDNETLLNRSTKIMPMPVQTHDLFNVSAQLMNGTFRVMHNAMPVYAPPSAFSSGKSAAISLEWNSSGTENTFGGGAEGSVVGTYSGNWLNGDDALSNLGEPNLNQSAYFKFIGEPSEHNSQYSSLASTYKPEKPVLRPVFTGIGTMLSPISAIANTVRLPHLTNMINGPAGSNALSKKNSNPNVASKTAKPIVHITEYEYKKLYTSQNFRNMDLSAMNAGDNTIAEFRITQDGGTQLNFGIPVYTNYQEDYVFSTDGITYSTSNSLPYSANVSYDTDENDLGSGDSDNGVGREGSYSKTVTPKFAHAYLLTEVLSDNYRDMSGDGPTADDLGYYTKFNWTKSHTEVNRLHPYGTINAMPGNLSDGQDDQAAFSMNEKEVYYVESIETKTHKAVFTYANDRVDALTYNRNGNPNTNPTSPKARLQYITLYKLDNNGALGHMIKKVHFKQSYNHWVGVRNSGPAGILGGVANARLTLDGIYTTYGEINNAEIEGTNRNEYNFEYFSSSYPSSSLGANESGNHSIDRWGNKQLITDNDYGVANHIIPYTSQDKATTGNNVKEGLLRTVKNPYGGSLEVDYESDDYGHVQDKKAMRMMKIVEVTSEYGEPITPQSSGSTELDGDDLYIVFELEEPASSLSENIDAYTEGLDQIYFKAFMGLKAAPNSSDRPAYFLDNNKAKEYIDGYAAIDKSFSPEVANYTDANGDYPYGILKIEDETIAHVDYHPFELSAIHSLKYNRFDLRSILSVNFSSGFNIKGATQAVSNIVQDVFSTMEQEYGYYRNAKNVLGYGDDIYWGELPSFVRLVDADGVKLGGGARVKSIVVNDGWDLMTSNNEADASYSRYYFYDNPDGTSSGVCTFEPSAGGEDSPLKMPVRSNGSDGFFFNDKALISTLPIGETYYPAPSVGYSRVTVYSNPERAADPYGNGVVEHAFYTAKDFPVVSSYTPIQRLGETPTDNVLRFLGLRTFNFVGMSQGFSVVLNNMHGKPKHVATYPSDQGAQLKAPISQTTYHYNTNTFNTAYVGTEKDVIDKNYIGREDIRLGQEMEAFLEKREAITTTNNRGIALDATFFGLIGPAPPTAFPRPSKAANGTRTAVLTKVFSLNATVDRVEQMMDGAVTLVENLMFDPYTGQSIYTKQKTPFKEETYQKTFLTHWDYADHRSSALNLGRVFKGNEAYGIVTEGDLIFNVSTGEKIWVTEIDQQNQQVTYRSDGNDALVSLQTATSYKIIRSGYRNNLSASTQAILTSKDVQDATNRPEDIFLEAWNDYVETQVVDDYQPVDCASGEDIGNTGFSNNSGSFKGSVRDWPSYPNITGDGSYLNGVHIRDLTPYADQDMIVFGDPCPLIVFFEPSFTNTIEDYKIYLTGPNSGIAVNRLDANDVYNVTITDRGYCNYAPCVEGVYEAAGSNLDQDIAVEVYDGQYTTPADNNPYKYNATNGFNRPKRSYVWQSNRLQTGALNNFETDISTDGELFEYISFSPLAYPLVGSTNNWVEASQMTLKDMHGHDLESVDALGIYSARLMGYCSDITTLVAQNARYNEIAFENFEKQDNCVDAEGNFNFSCTNCGVDATAAHTGNYSYLLANSGSLNLINGGLSLDNNEKYVLRFWAQEKVSGSGAVPYWNGGSTSIVPILVDINGWTLYEQEFTYSTGSQAGLSGSNALLIDDILIKPIDASAQAYVYDEVTGRMLAVLDNNHLAQMYTYDITGMLNGTKVETRDGLQSLNASTTAHSKLNNQ